MSEIEIRQLTRELASQYGPVLLELNRDSDWENWTMENMLAERDGKWELSSIAFDGVEPVGYAIASRTAGGAHFHHLAIAPRWRPRGLGIRLIARLAETLQHAGISELTLKVYRTNDRSWKMYLMFGFEMFDGPTPELVTMRASVATLAAKVAPFARSSSRPVKASS